MIRFFLIIFFLITTANIFAQRCDNKDFCDKELFGEYDFRSQSNYVQVYTGDTVRVKVVIYSGQNYRIFTCAERKLKDVCFRIIFPEKRFKRTIKKITQKEVPIYEKDKEGNVVYDENDKRIKTGTIFAKDTIWERNLVTSESVIYDSRKAEENYWQANIHKTRLIIIETIIPQNESLFTQRNKKRAGCIQIMVGRKYETASQFRR